MGQEWLAAREDVKPVMSLALFGENMAGRTDKVLENGDLERLPNSIAVIFR